MFKRFRGFIGLVLVTMLLCVAPATAAPTVNLDGQQLSFEVPPTIEDGRTLVPLRAIFEAMGATVTWDGNAQTATGVKGATTVNVKIGSVSPTINGVVKPLDVPAKIVDGRTLAPLRFVGEAFGATVEWDDFTQTASIVSEATSPASQYTDPLQTSIAETLTGVPTKGITGWALAEDDADLRTFFCNIEVENSKDWESLSKNQRETILKDILNILKKEYPSWSILISIKINYNYSTWSPGLEDNIYSFEVDRGWKVSNTYTIGSASYTRMRFLDDLSIKTTINPDGD